MNHRIAISAVLLSLVAAAAGAGAPALDPLTKLPLPTAADAVQVAAPMKLPDATVCKSAMRGNYYSDVTGNIDAVVAWYAAQLKDFRPAHGYAMDRAQHAFYNSTGTQVVVVTGNRAPAGQNTGVFAVAYEQYEPGLTQKQIVAIASGNIDCR
jgi:hypothetical protein